MEQPDDGQGFKKTTWLSVGTLVVQDISAENWPMLEVVMAEALGEGVGVGDVVGVGVGVILGVGVTEGVGVGVGVGLTSFV